MTRGERHRWHYLSGRQLASFLLARCFAREGGEANGVHNHYFIFDVVARNRNKKRLAATRPKDAASLN